MPVYSTEIGKPEVLHNPPVDFPAASVRSNHDRKFMGMLAHELRNSLNDVRLLLEMAKYTADPATEAAVEPEMPLPSTWRAMDKPLKRMSELVCNLMDLCSVTHATFRLSNKQEDLRDVVQRAACEAKKVVFARSGVILHFDLPPYPVWVLADTGRLEMAIENLLSNAARHTPVGGSVRIAVTAEGINGVVRVSDSGTGIEPSMLPHVFDPFVRGKTGQRWTSSSSHSAGLGLLLVRTLVELHGGRASVRNVWPGTGTEFALHLPRLIKV
ncbi:MAG TPA: HAMP domain-containing sensor histidine kinase [Tepidisphaeraceae bacterium]|jgi:signal transduction histidine kinase